MRVLVFDTTHHALWAEQVANGAGLAAAVIPAPAAARARCDLALEYLPEDEAELLQALSAAGIACATIRFLSPGGGLPEPRCAEATQWRVVSRGLRARPGSGTCTVSGTLSGFMRRKGAPKSPAPPYGSHTSLGSVPSTKYSV